MNIPILRFKKFNSPWSASALGNMGNIITGTTPDTSKPEYYVNGDKLFVSPADINDQRYIHKTKTLVTEEGMKTGRTVQAKSVLFVSIGSTIGKVAQNASDCITNQQINAIVPNDKFDAAFLYSLLEKEASKIKLLAATQAVPIINKTSFSKIVKLVPEIDEQREIGNFLSCLDSKVSLITKKHELLLAYKRGVMQKIFSLKTRFKDEDGNDFPNWEVVKLESIAYSTTGSSNRIDSNLLGKYAFFDRSEDVRTSDKFLFDCEAIIVGGEGQTFTPKYFVGKFDLHQRAYAIKDFKGCHGKYIYYYIANNVNYFQSKAVGSTVKSLRLPMFNQMPVRLPSSKEQEKIANFLTMVDSRISNLSKQLNLAKRYKQALLQKMFI